MNLKVGSLHVASRGESQIPLFLPKNPSIGAFLPGFHPKSFLGHLPHYFYYFTMYTPPVLVADQLSHYADSSTSAAFVDSAKRTEYLLRDLL